MPTCIISRVTQRLAYGSASLMSIVAVIKCAEAVCYRPRFNVTFRTKAYIFHQGPSFKGANEKSEWQFNSERCWRQLLWFMDTDLQLRGICSSASSSQQQPIILHWLLCAGPEIMEHMLSSVPGKLH